MAMTRYKVQREVARGGMGTVYRALDVETGATVAVKMLAQANAEGTERFRREAAILSSLSHPGIVRYLDHGMSEQGVPYLVMEWLDGEPLSARLHREGLRPSEAIDLVSQVARAVGAAHALGLVHRDIKPSNVLVPAGGTNGVKLIDFGVGRWNDSPLDGSLTRTGMLLGTAGYMAPEQIRNARGIDARADVFALGCVLYECLTGRAPFGGENSQAMRVKVLFAEPPRLRQLVPELPDLLEMLVRWMLRKDPERRPADGDAVARELATLPPLEGPCHPTDRASRISTSPVGQPQETPSASYTSLIMVGIEEETHSEAGISQSAELAPQPLEPAIPPLVDEITRQIGADLYVLPDRSLVIQLAAATDAMTVALAAAQCGLRIRGALPNRPIAIATGPSDSNPSWLDAMIDVVTAQLQNATLDAIFAGYAPDSASARAIHVCERTAKLLAASYSITVMAASHLLRPVDSPTTASGVKYTA
jgi:serine/threonine protein kinase